MSRYYISAQDDGRYHVLVIWDDGSGESEMEFATLEAALGYTGGTRFDMNGGEVDVFMDGQYIDDQGNITDYRSGDSDGWQWGTDSD